MLKAVIIAVLMLVSNSSSSSSSSEQQRQRRELLLRHVHNVLAPIKYIYIYDEEYDQDFGSSLLDLKYRYKESRVFLYSSDSLKESFYETAFNHNRSNTSDYSSFNFYWYNVFCHLIHTAGKTNDSSEQNIVFFVENFKLLIQLQKLSPCLMPNHLVFVFEYVNPVIAVDSIVAINSVIFAISSTHIAYIDTNLKIVEEYTFVENITAEVIEQRMKSIVLNETTTKCLCSNGQVKLRIGIIQKPFYVFDDNNGDLIQSDLTYELFAKDLFNEIASALKISYEIVPCGDHNHIGTKIGNNNWTGLIGMLIRDEIDVAVSAIRIDTQRSKDIDFTFPIFSDTYGMLMHAAKPFQYSVLDVFLPFSYELWLCIFAAILFMGIILYLLYRFDIFFSNHYTIEHSNASETHHKLEFSFRKCLTFTFARLFGQNVDYQTKHVPSRIVVVTWWLFGITIMASYTANLTAFLTSNEQEVIIDKLEQLADSTNFKPLIYKGTNAEALFKFSEDKTKKKIWERLMNDKNLPQQSDATVSSLVRKKNYIFIGEYTLLTYYTSYYCDLAKSTEGFDLSEYAFGLQKNSPFKDELTNYIIRLREGGITNLIFKKNINIDEKAICDEQTLNITEIDSFYGVLLTIACSILLGFILLIGERCIQKYLWNKETGGYDLKKIKKNTDRIFNPRRQPPPPAVKTSTQNS